MANPDLEILTALIMQHVNCRYSHCRGSAGQVSAERTAQAILRTGFKMRDPELERRVDQLEKWTRGEFT